MHLALHGGLILAFGLAIYLGLPFWQLLLIPQGIAIVFLFTLLHEAVHQTPFRTPWLNGMAARVSGFLLFLPSTWFKYFHLAHHRFTQIPGKDPELATEKPKTRLGFVKHMSGIPTWIGHFKILVQNASGDCSADFLPKKAETRIVKESRLLILAYSLILCGALFLGSTALFWIWIFPLLLGQPFLRLYLLAEHGLCPTVANMFDNTAQLPPIRWCGLSRGICHTTPSITLIPRCRSTNYLNCIRSCSPNSLFGSTALFWIWILPVFLGQPFLRHPYSFWQNMDYAQRWQTYLTTHAQLSPIR